MALCFQCSRKKLLFTLVSVRVTVLYDKTSISKPIYENCFLFLAQNVGISYQTACPLGYITLPLSFLLTNQSPFSGRSYIVRACLFKNSILNN